VWHGLDPFAVNTGRVVDPVSAQAVRDTPRGEISKGDLPDHGGVHAFGLGCLGHELLEQPDVGLVTWLGTFPDETDEGWGALSQGLSHTHNTRAH
jgi:hypothetical protein